MLAETPMKYKEKSVLPLIESTYAVMTPTEKSVASFFLKGKEADDYSLKNMAALLSVSEASLVRFAKKCGFKGYREFIYQYEKGLSTAKPAENITQSSLDVLEAYQDLLTNTYSLIQEDQICRIAQMITDARKVLVGGIGSSGYAAREMAYRFMRIGLPIEAYDDVDMMRMIAVFRDDQDLVIGLSLSGTRREFLEYLRVSKERGAKTILITSTRYSAYDAFIDEVVLVPSLLHMNQGNLISPQFPLLVIIDILYAAYMRYNSDEKKNYHDQTLKVLDQQGEPGVVFGSERNETGQADHLDVEQPEKEKLN